MARIDRNRASAPPSDSSLVSVRFARSHTHAGVQYAAGDAIAVPPAMAALLRQFNAIEADTEAAAMEREDPPDDADAPAADSDGG